MKRVNLDLVQYQKEKKIIVKVKIFIIFKKEIVIKQKLKEEGNFLMEKVVDYSLGKMKIIFEQIIL